jgi:hypothetical protein
MSARAEYIRGGALHASETGVVRWASIGIDRLARGGGRSVLRNMAAGPFGKPSGRTTQMIQLLSVNARYFLPIPHIRKNRVSQIGIGKLCSTQIRSGKIRAGQISQ